MIGKILDHRYQIESILGLGGMGMVFRAMQTVVKRPVAVKTLHPSLAAAPEFFERFRREAEIASRLRHPNIITIFDFGKAEDGTCYFVMELVPGESLKQLVKSEGPLTLRRAVNIIEQAARGLAHAHAENVVHRDIKPHNLLISSVDGKDFVKILDFGLVKALEIEDEEQLTSTGQVLGTPQYMPPEQAGGEVVDRRSDLYSLGSVFYYCLTGVSPFGANTVRKALTASLTQAVPLVDSKRIGAPVPRKLDEFFRKSLASEKDNRHQTAEEFISEMRQALAGLSDEDLDAQPAMPEPSRENAGSAEKQRTPASKSGSKISKFSRSGKATPSNIVLDRALAASPVRETEPDLPAQTTRAERIAAPARKPGRRIVAIAAPLVLLGGAALVWSPWAKPSFRDRPTPEAVKPLPALSNSVTVKLRSSPMGADVFEGDVKMGRTPLDVPLARDKIHPLAFRLQGYGPVGQNLDLSQYAESIKHIDVQLEPTVDVPRPALTPLTPTATTTPPPKKKKTSNIPVFE